MKPLAQNTLIQNRYLIVHLIGKGGMGEVYLAVDQRLGSAVALKRTFFAGDEMLSNAFEREARILARMRHPVLPKVSDHFSEGDEQYLVMEHISGDDLSKRLEAAQKPFPMSWVMFWADQLLDALSYLHSHEPPIIHRDIKPQNLKLTDENHVILLDFGLSKNSTGQTKLESGSGSSGSTGSVVGYTPHYAPMEQIRGIGTNPRSDIYSLSATLYQLLTNKVPPDALSRADEMLNGSPDPITSPSAINAEIPEAVSEVILKGMEVSQDKRFATAREMQKAMRKSYAQMQEAMGANTVIMSAEGTSVSDSVPVAVPSMDRTEVMDYAANPAMSVPTAVATGASEAPTNLVSQPQPKPFDPNATIAFDPEPLPTDEPSHISEPRQADVKTEVFLAGSNSLPTPPMSDIPASESVSYSGAISQTPASEDFAAANVSFDPNATVPISAYAGEGDVAALPDNQTNYYTSDVEQQSSAPAGFESAASFSANGSAVAEASPAFVQPAQSVSSKKSSGGKVFAAIAAVLVLFVLGAGAIGGGLYYYNNYYAAAEPSPSPSAEPSAEPTFDVYAESNSNTEQGNTASVANTNTSSNAANTDVVTVAPTPEPTTPVQTQTDSPPQQTGTTTRPSTQARNTPSARPPGPSVPAATKPTPKPSSTRDRKVILQ